MSYGLFFLKIHKQNGRYGLVAQEISSLFVLDFPNK